MKMMTLLILAMISTGCLTYKSKPPLPSEVKALVYEVSKRPYKIHVYDCTNMSYDLTQLLRTYEYDARIIRYTPIRKDGTKFGHALVELVYDDFVYYIDPTLKLGMEMVEKPKYNIEQIFTTEVFELAKNRKWLEMVKEDYKGHTN